jgi:hypothetical protein
MVVPIAKANPMAGLEFEMIYHLRVRGPMPATQGAPLGERIYWEMSAGTLEGPRIKARIAMPGGDWYRPGADGFGQPDVRVQFVTDDDAVILLHYTGLVQMNDTFTKAAEAGSATRFEDHYMRMAMRFDAGAPKYAWLNQHLFVAEGRLTGKDQIQYRVYRVT